ncbi:MAG: hypothetical protein AAFN94_03125 [Pseudomonadota bacterium]
MASLHLHQTEQLPIHAPASVPALDPDQFALLNHIRMAAMGCRAAARVDLFEACALLTLDGETARRTFVSTFVKCLSDAVNKRIIWHRPGTAELSFDEAWVMRVFTAIRDEDRASLDFLLRSRVAPADRRYIGFLLNQISDQFCRV